MEATSTTSTQWHQVPRISETVRLRKREPFAYDSKTFRVLEFNDAGISILRLVDGQRSVMEIARCLAGDHPSEQIESLAGKCHALLDRCAKQGAILWS